MAERPFDIVLHGATGFTGRLVAAHLQRVARQADIIFALSGRSLDKLRSVRDEIGADQTLALIECDADDATTVAAMAARTRSVISTAGPYQHFGEPVLAACVEAGTDYLDLCGEVAWMRHMIDRYEAKAKSSGARILFSSGFDSIPSELGVLVLQHEAKARFGRPAPQVFGRVLAIRGGYSGGTLASGAATVEAIGRDGSIAALLADPFALTPGWRGPPQSGEDQAPLYDAAMGVWTAPFPLSSINTRNVHRSNFLQGEAYGRDFRYEERLVTGAGEQGRQAAEQLIADVGRPEPNAPKPGEGPSAADRAAGYYHLLFIGVMEDGRRIEVAVRGDQDPGYGSTSKIIAETAIFLRRRGAAVAGGIWTPGAALGRALAERLDAHAGLSFHRP